MDDDLRALLEHGYSLFPAVIEVVGSFSGLFVEIVGPHGPAELTFSAARACTCFDRSKLGEYEGRADTALLPVGQLSLRGWVLLLGQNGRWYGVRGDDVGLLGADVFECIESLIHSDDFKEKLPFVAVEQSTRFSLQTQHDLRTAGWFPGRKVDVTRWQERLEAEGAFMHGAARRFLAEFGGLSLKINGPGITSAREPFGLDPYDLDCEVNRFLDWGDELRKSLFPIGAMDRGRFLLGISELGEIYLVTGRPALFGRGDQGLEALVLGVKPERIA